MVVTGLAGCGETPEQATERNKNASPQYAIAATVCGQSFILAKQLIKAENDNELAMGLGRLSDLRVACRSTLNAQWSRAECAAPIREIASVAGRQESLTLNGYSIIHHGGAAYYGEELVRNSDQLMAQMEASISKYEEVLASGPCLLERRQVGSQIEVPSARATEPQPSQQALPYTPSRSTADRKALMDAVRPQAEARFGAPVEFVVNNLLVLEGYAYADLAPQRPGGSPVPCASDSPCTQSNRTRAILKADASGWRAVDVQIGDVALSECAGVPDRLVPECG